MPWKKKQQLWFPSIAASSDKWVYPALPLTFSRACLCVLWWETWLGEWFISAEKGKTADSSGKPFLSVPLAAAGKVCVKQRGSPVCVHWNKWHVQWESGWSVRLVLIHLMKTSLYKSCPNSHAPSVYSSACDTQQSMCRFQPLPTARGSTHCAICPTGK